jgi:hypothetical protein
MGAHDTAGEYIKECSGKRVLLFCFLVFLICISRATASAPVFKAEEQCPCRTLANSLASNGSPLIPVALGRCGKLGITTKYVKYEVTQT